MRSALATLLKYEIRPPTWPRQGAWRVLRTLCEGRTPKSIEAVDFATSFQAHELTGEAACLRNLRLNGVQVRDGVRFSLRLATSCPHSCQTAVALAQALGTSLRMRWPER